jgi:hypothetical protein
MKLIATWTTEQNNPQTDRWIDTDNPVSLRWEDGTPAHLADFMRIDRSTESYRPDLRGATVEYSYDIEVSQRVQDMVCDACGGHYAHELNCPERVRGFYRAGWGSNCK